MLSLEYRDHILFLPRSSLRSHANSILSGAWLDRADVVRKGSKAGKKIETWAYNAYDTVWSQQFGGHYSHGYRCGAGYFYEPIAYHVPYTAAKVNFSNSRVDSWHVRKR